MLKKLFLLFKVVILIIIILNILSYVNISLKNNNYNDTSVLNTNNKTQTNIIEKLQLLSKEDSRINEIIDNKDNYPPELLEMLSRNIDMLDYVLEFPNKRGQVFSNNIGKVKEGVYPLLLQYDERWGYASYGENYLAISGCAPTALAIVIAGLTGNNMVTPYTVSKYAMDNGYYTNGAGTSWSLMTEGSSYFGVTGTQINLSKNEVYTSLESGHPIICSMGPGDFTTEGHFIVLTDIKNGKIKIIDPNSKDRSNKLWNYDTLEYQIKNLWSFS